jgi:hypothetical protein
MRRDGAGVRGPAPPAQKKVLPRRVSTPSAEPGSTPRPPSCVAGEAFKLAPTPRRETLRSSAILGQRWANAACMGIDYAVVPTFRDSVAAVAA